MPPRPCKHLDFIIIVVIILVIKTSGYQFFTICPFHLSVDIWVVSHLGL